jgi:hypothetical protein
VPTARVVIPAVFKPKSRKKPGGRLKECRHEEAKEETFQNNAAQSFIRFN